jgi:hypothetical protein
MVFREYSQARSYLQQRNSQNCYSSPNRKCSSKLRYYESRTASLITTMSAKIHEPPSGAKERKVLVRDTGFPEPLCSGAT